MQASVRFRDLTLKNEKGNVAVSLRRVVQVYLCDLDFLVPFASGNSIITQSNCPRARSLVAGHFEPP